MRITHRIATDPNDGIVQFPVCTKTLDQCLDKDGHIDYAKAQSALMEANKKAQGTVVIGGNDGANVLAFAIEFMYYSHEWMKQIVGQVGAGAKITDNDYEPQTRAEKRMAKGLVAYSRIHITSRSGGKEIVVRVEYANPKQAMGEAENDAKITAIMNIQTALYIAKLWNDDPQNIVQVVVEDHEKCKGLVREAEVDYAHRKIRDAKRECTHRCYGSGMTLCSPIDPQCQFFKNGRCEYK